MNREMHEGSTGVYEQCTDPACPRRQAGFEHAHLVEVKQPQPEYPTCKVCGHAARHRVTNMRVCDECGGPCVTEAGWRGFGNTSPWPGRVETE